MTSPAPKVTWRTGMKVGPALLAWVGVSIGAAALWAWSAPFASRDWLTAVQYVALLGLGAALFWSVPLRDPVGFVSIVTPLVALAAGAASAEANWQSVALAGIAIGYVAFLQLGKNRAWNWWSRTILRRTLPSPEHRFEHELFELTRDSAAAVKAGLKGQTTLAAAGAAMDHAIAALEGIEAPSPGWATLRDAHLDLMRTERRWLDGTDWYAELDHDVAERGRLNAIRAALRVRTSEWRGPFPTLPESETIPEGTSDLRLREDLSDGGEPTTRSNYDLG